MAIASKEWSIIYKCYAPCILVCQFAWWALNRPDASYRARKLDATLSVWIADASDAEQNRRVGCRLREALELDDGALTWRSSNAHRRPM